jgi:SAM-dependent methyltransferase
VAYWQRAGDRIGDTAAPAAPPRGLEHMKMRAVRIRPDVVRAITPEDVNIVLQRPDVSADRQFDLVIATNILIYYDVFEQSLALANISRILRPGGLLLTNTPLFELPTIPMRAVGGTTVTYMAGASDGVVWYRRQ